MCLSPRMKAMQREEKALLERLKLWEWEILENLENELEEEENEHLEQLTADNFDLTLNEIFAISLGIVLGSTLAFIVIFVLRFLSLIFD